MKEASGKSNFLHHWRGMTLLIIGLFFLTLVVESWFKQDDFRMFVDLELVSFMIICIQSESHRNMMQTSSSWQLFICNLDDSHLKIMFLTFRDDNSCVDICTYFE